MLFVCGGVANLFQKYVEDRHIDNFYTTNIEKVAVSITLSNNLTYISAAKSLVHEDLDVIFRPRQMKVLLEGDLNFKPIRRNARVNNAKGTALMAHADRYTYCVIGPHLTKV